MNAVIIQGDNFLPVKKRLKCDGPKIIKKLYFPERLVIHKHLYICFLFPAIYITDFEEILLALLKQQGEPTIISRVRMSCTTLPDLFLLSCLGSYTTLFKRIEKSSSLRKSSFQLQQRDFTSIFSRRS